MTSSKREIDSLLTIIILCMNLLFLSPYFQDLVASQFSGRSLSNSVINLGIRDQYADALTQLGFDFEVLAEQVSSLIITSFVSFPLNTFHA